jgi:hypothetical protein
MGDVEDVTERHHLHSVAVPIEIGVTYELKSGCVLRVHRSPVPSVAVGSPDTVL